jgi:hypothetical protein
VHRGRAPAFHVFVRNLIRLSKVSEHAYLIRRPAGDGQSDRFMIATAAFSISAVLKTSPSPSTQWLFVWMEISE